MMVKFSLHVQSPRFQKGDSYGFIKVYGMEIMFISTLSSANCPNVLFLNTGSLQYHIGHLFTLLGQMA